ncbi:MAG: hypothetical protein DWQ02_23835 [Bacteroidetes bacterium]|nr:MAG: hypothetical protein DWQ02_23835 [Bacteroidota bacterium]
MILWIKLRRCDSEWWTVDDGRKTIDGGRKTIDGRRWTVDDRRWTGWFAGWLFEGFKEFEGSKKYYW